MSMFGCSVDIVQWSEDLYEEQLVTRTIDACGGHVDIVIDFSATSRSVRRAMRCLQPVSGAHRLLPIMSGYIQNKSLFSFVTVWWS